MACCRDTVGAEEAQGAASTHASIKHLAAIRLVQYVIVGLAETVYLYGMPPDRDHNSSPAVAWLLPDSGPKQCPTPVIGDRLLRQVDRSSCKSSNNLLGQDHLQRIALE